MLIAVDVSNTNTKVGVYDGERLVRHWRLRTDPDRTADEYGVFLRGLLAQPGEATPRIRGAIVASVVPPMNDTIDELLRALFGVTPLFVGPGIRTGISVAVDNPKEVGADRIVNAVAAYERAKGAAIVVDMGTATTFDYVTAKGEYAGGLIVPGISISLDALGARTAKLPRVELARPPRVVGRNTIHAIQAGVIFGYTALVDGLVERIRRENDPNAQVFATGGLAHLIQPESTTITAVDEYLTLDGLRIIYDRNGGYDAE
jgi:type III pantothenate kinase